MPHLVRTPGRTRARVVGAAMAAVLVSPACSSSALDAAGSTVSALDGAQLSRALESARRDSGAPGVSAAVVRDGEVVWADASGTRIAAGRGGAVDPDTAFITASTAKSVTAAMVLRLVDEGRVRLGARVARWYPRLPGARRILVADLLRHASGLPDYLDSRRLSRLIDTRPYRQWQRDELLRDLRRLRFAPGTRYAYSNTNSIVLGGIVEKVTGTSIQAAFEELLGDPLDLRTSTWVHRGLPLTRVAEPHLGGLRARQLWSGGRVPHDVWGEVWTDGGLATTAPELARLTNAMVAGDLLARDTRSRMLRLGRGGAGLGVFSERIDGRRWIGHDGLYGGFSSQHWTDPATGTTVVVMANLEVTGRRPDTSMMVLRKLAGRL